MNAEFTPRVRITDRLSDDPHAPLRFVVSGVPDPDAVAAACEQVTLDDAGRLTVIATVGEFTALLRGSRGDRVTEPVVRALEEAVAAHGAVPRDIVTRIGVLDTSTRPLVMGVLNVTPDSFSDGGVSYDAAGDPVRAIGAGMRLLAEGADIVDVGGESTRPGARPVAEQEELRRVLPVVAALADAGAVVSIDTRKASVARAAVEAGAALVNDVSGGAVDGAMWSVVAELGVPYVLMHAQGTPETMQDAPSYADVVAEVFEHLARRLDALGAAGIAPERVILDPGIGFGKTVEHNLLLLQRLGDFTSLGRPLLVGASRKGFLGALTGVRDAAQRVDGSLAAAAAVTLSGAAIVRAHDVARTVRVVRTAVAVRDAGAPTARIGGGDPSVPASRPAVPPPAPPPDVPASIGEPPAGTPTAATTRDRRGG